MTSPLRRLRVASIVPPPYVTGRHATAANAAAVARFLAPLRAEGAHLILLPDVFPQGYSYNARCVWRSVDRGLPTAASASFFPNATAAPATHALAQMAVAADAFVGATVLEYHAGSNSVLNTFVLARPDGRIHPQLSSKCRPAHFEAFVFTGGQAIAGRDARVLEVPGLGGEDGSSSGSPHITRVGVSICYDNYIPASLASLAAADPHLVLMPHCCPVAGATLGFPQSESAAFARTVVDAARHVSALLRVPTVFTNQSGPWPAAERLPWLWGPLTSVQLRGAFYSGGGRVVDGHGAVVAEVSRDGKAPGYCVGDVTLAEQCEALTGYDRRKEPTAAAIATATGRRGPDPSAASASTLATSAGDDGVRALRVTPGCLALPPLLQTMAPLNEGVGRWWYSQHAEERKRICAEL